jgi:hypothetical protein
MARMTYHGRYTSWDFERGQEGDPWKGVVGNYETPPTLIERRSANSNPQSLKQMWRQDWINRELHAHRRRSAAAAHL